MKMIVGLGNPGLEYENTRHNIGFMALNYFPGNINKEKFNALYTKIKVNDEDVLFVKPLTYMNLSGDAVGEFARYFKIDTDDIYYIEVVGHIIVIHSKSGVFETRSKSLKAIAEDLKEYGFIQSGQSHLINLKFVDKVKGDVVTVAGEELFLSRSRKKEFIAAFGDYVGMEI